MNQKYLSNQNLSHILRSLSLLLHGGLTLTDGVYLLHREQPDRQELAQLAQLLDRGLPLWEAMEQTGVFPQGDWAMVRIGEEAGKLEQTLSALADYHDQRHRTGKLLQNALLYPSMTLALLVVVMGVLLVEVLPIFDSVYGSLGSQLTGLAAGLLHLGSGLKAAMPVLLGLLAVVLVAAVVFSLSDPGRRWLVRSYRNRFGDRGISRKFNNARFAQGLAMGLGSGIALEEALELAALLLREDPAAEKRCSQCIAALQRGSELSDALGQSGLLDASSCRILSVGLRSGSGDSVMAQLAARQLEEAEEALEQAIAKIEPTLVLAASVLVGMILLSVMLPLLDILSVLG